MSYMLMKTAEKNHHGILYIRVRSWFFRYVINYNEIELLYGVRHMRKLLSDADTFIRSECFFTDNNEKKLSVFQVYFDERTQVLITEG